MMDFLTNTYWGGIIAVCIGIAIIIFALRQKDYFPKNARASVINGVLSGLAFLIGGIIVLYNKLLGNW